jgi:hypothetical protein
VGLVAALSFHPFLPPLDETGMPDGSVGTSIDPLNELIVGVASDGNHRLGLCRLDESSNEVDFGLK